MWFVYYWQLIVKIISLIHKFFHGMLLIQFTSLERAPTMKNHKFSDDKLNQLLELETLNIDQLVMEEKGREDEDDLNFERQHPPQAQLILREIFKKVFVTGNICLELTRDHQFSVSRPTTVTASTRLITLDLEIFNFFRLSAMPLSSPNHCLKGQMKTIDMCCNAINTMLFKEH